jgi:hypothetical protein
MHNPVSKNSNLTLGDVERLERTDEYGIYPQSRVISNLCPMVVRQNDPGVAKYQEGLGYTFLVNSMKRPRMARMADGRLIMSATAWLSPLRPCALEQQEHGLLIFSEDDGKSWGQPRRAALRGTPIALGGRHLLFYGWQSGMRETDEAFLWSSEDGGETWSEAESVPRLADGREMYFQGSVLVESDTVWFIFWTPEFPAYHHWQDGEIFASALVRCYHPRSRRWDAPHFFPKAWGLNEGSIIRAQNGNLVAALRTQMIGVPIQSDHYMGLATCVSRDDGKTWSEPVHHFRFGHHHAELLMLPDGRIVMTYAARIGELDGKVYHGVEAVVSRDHGESWDWDRRYILFRWHDQCLHSPQSVLLSDGGILTAFLHGESYSWTDGPEHPVRNGINLVLLGNVSAVIWRV